MGAWSPCSHACPGGADAGTRRRPAADLAGAGRGRRGHRGRAWPGWGWPSSSSRRWTPPAGSAPAARSRWPAGCWLLAQGGELDIGVRAARRWPRCCSPSASPGACRGPAACVARLHDLTAGRDVAPRAAGAGRGRARRCSPSLLGARRRRPGRRGRAAPDRRAAPPSSRSRRSAGGWAGSPALLDAAWTGCPAPRGRCCAACWPACSPRWRCARPSSRSRWPSDAHGYATLSGSLGGAAAGALGLLGLGVLLLPERGGRRPGAGRRARASPSAPARSSRCTGSRWAPCPRCRCWPRCPTPRPCR